MRRRHGRRRVPFVVPARLAGEVDTPLDITHLEHLIAQKHLLARSRSDAAVSARPNRRRRTRLRRLIAWKLKGESGRDVAILGSNMLCVSLMESAPDARHQPRGARAGIPRGYTLRPVDNVERFLLGLDHAQWRHTLGIVHRHYRAFQRGRRGATLRKGRSTMGPSTTVYLR